MWEIINNRNGHEISGMNNESRKFLNITRVLHGIMYDVS
jgi:hypothetical protein